MKATIPTFGLPFLLRSIFIILFTAISWLSAGESTTCYAVSDGRNELISISQDGSHFKDIGSLGVDSIEAIALDPEHLVLYGANAGKFGVISLSTGAFSSIGSFGKGNGIDGTVSFCDVDSLAFDPTNGFLYGVARRSNGKDDVFFRINPTTGSCVRNAFGSGHDYVMIKTHALLGLPDIDDIAFDASGQLFAIVNKSSGDHLIEIDKTNGSVVDISRLMNGEDDSGLNDMEGLTFLGGDFLYGTTGDDGSRKNCMWRIDKTTGVSIKIKHFPSFSDYEAIACRPGGGHSDDNGSANNPPPQSSGTGRLAGRVWHDKFFSRSHKVNGIRDGGEAGIQNVVVGLYDTHHQLIRTTQTDGNGYYEFTNLAKTTYRIKVLDSNFVSGGVMDGSDTAVDWYATREDACANDTVDSDGDERTHDVVVSFCSCGDKTHIDFGFYKSCVNFTKTGPDSMTPGVPFNFHFRVENCGDVVLHGGLHVYDALLHPSGNHEIWHTVSYPGSVHEFDKPYTPQSGDCPSMVNNAFSIGHPVNPKSGCGLPGVRDDDRWTVTCLQAAIGDAVWYDNDRDGIQDSGEEGVEGITVKLLNAGGQTLATTHTNASGRYLFNNLAAGNYRVLFDLDSLPAGYFVSPKNAGNNNDKDSDADPDTGKTELISLSNGEKDRTLDMGIYRPEATLGDLVWFDSDHDGIQDDDEKGIQGITVKLYKGTTYTGRSTTTGAHGYYHFSHLDTGTYHVKFTIPSGYTISPKDRGNNDAKDSDANSNGETPSTVLEYGEVDPTWDLGLYRVQPDKNICFVASDEDDELAYVSTDGTEFQDIGNLDVSDIEAMAFSLDQTILYGANAGQLGRINTQTGEFTTIGSFGEGHGLQGDVRFRDVDSLEFDPTNGALYGVSRIGDHNDVLFRISPATGAYVPNAFGSGKDYVVVDTKSVIDVYDIDDIAIDSTGQMYGSANTGSSHNHLIKINKSTGAVIDVARLKNSANGHDLDDMEGLTFFSGDTLYGVTGDGGSTSDSMWSINKTTGKATKLVHFPQFTDYEAIACKGDGAKASLGDFVWYDTNENGIQDANEMGVPSVNVRLFDAQGNSLASTQTDVNGKYQFNQLTPGTYKLLFVPSSLPEGYVISPKDQGNNDAKDSDADPQNGWVTSITLAPGASVTHVDMGIYRKLTCRSGFTLYKNNSNSHRGVHLYDGGTTRVEITSAFGNALHGSVKVTIEDAFTWDGYANRKTHVQNYEKARVVFVDSQNHKYNSGYTQDIVDSINYGDRTTDLGTVNLGNGANKVYVSHYEDPAYGSGSVSSANSLYFKGFCYKVTTLGVPHIEIEKSTNDQDADSGTGPVVTIGSTVTWKYVVKNTGDVKLKNIHVTDDKIGTISCPATTLDVGQNMTCTQTGIAQLGQYANKGTVTAKDACGHQVNDHDLSHYKGILPPLTCPSGYNKYELTGNGLHMYDGGTTKHEITDVFGDVMHSPSKITIKEVLTWDGYQGRSNHNNQEHEQDRVVFVDAQGGVIHTSYTTDIPNGEYAALFTDLGMANLPTGATKAYLVHYEDPTYGSGSVPSANSLYFKGFCYKVTEEIQPTANLVTIKKAQKSHAAVGESVTFTFLVTNHGPDTATNISLADNIPGSLTEVALDASQGTVTLANNSRLAKWTIGDLANGETATMTLTGKVSDGMQGGVLANFTQAAQSQDVPDPTTDGDILIAKINIDTPPTPPIGCSAIFDWEQSGWQDHQKHGTITLTNGITATIDIDTNTSGQFVFDSPKVDKEYKDGVSYNEHLFGGISDLGIVFDPAANTGTSPVVIQLTFPEPVYNASFLISDIDTYSSSSHNNDRDDKVTVTTDAGDAILSVVHADRPLVEVHGNSAQTTMNNYEGSYDDSRATVRVLIPNGATKVTIIYEEIDENAQDHIGRGIGIFGGFSGCQGSSVHGHLYQDANNNNKQDNGEPNLTNVDVKITDAAGKVVVATTDSNGNYRADHLTAGDAIIDIDQNDPDFLQGAIQTEGDDPTTVAIAAGQDTFEENNGFFLSAPAIALEKTSALNDGGNGIQAGDTITYTFKVTNTGNVPLKSARITDDRIHVNGLVVGDLNVGQSKTATATYALTQQDINDGNVTNRATVEAKDPQDKPVTDLSDDPTNPANVDPNGDGNPDDPTVTPLVTNPPVAVDDNKSGTPGQSVTLDTLANDSDINGDLDPKTVKILDPDGNPVTELVVAGEGKWTVDPDNGKITFTPEAGFYADPAPIQYTVQDTAGHTSNPATETVHYNVAPAIALEKTSALNDGGNGIQAGDTITYTFKVTNTGNVPLKSARITDDRIHVNGLVVGDLNVGQSKTATATYALTQQDINDGNVTNRATVEAKDPQDKPVTDLSDDPTNPANVDPNGDGNPDDPTVTPLVTNPPVAVDDNKSGTPGQSVTLDTLANDSDINGDLDPKTVKILDPDGNPVTELVVAGEGKWTVDPDNGKITFTPEAGFYADPAPIQYTVQDTAGHTSNPATETVHYNVAPAIALEKTSALNDGGNGIQAGDTITYTFKVTNTGNVPLKSARITDDRIHVNGLVVGDLNVGQSKTATATYALTQQDINDGNVTNRATVEAKDPQDKPVTDLSDDPTNPANVDPNGDGNPDDPTVTPLVTNPPVAVDDNKSGTPGQSVTLDTLANDSDINGDLDPKTVKILDPDGNPVTELVVAGEGKWTVDPDNGKITFTPEAGFYADPAPIQYTVQDTAGHTSNPATETVHYNVAPAIALEKTSALNDGGNGIQAGDTITYTFKVTNTGNVPLKSARITDDRIHVNGLVVGDLNVGQSKTATATYALTQQDINDGNVTNRATVEAKDPQDKPVTDLSDDPTNPANVDPNGDGNPDDPTVTPLVTNPPVAVDDNKSGTPGQSVTLDTLANDSDINGDLDPKTVKILDPDGNPVTELVVAGEGKWTVDPDNGKITFTPEAGFYADPAPIQYTVQDTAGHTSNPATETVHYNVAPAIALEKTSALNDGGNGIQAGDTITYTFKVTNTGNVPLKSARITDDRIHVNGLVVGDLNVGQSKTATATYALTQQDINDGNVTNRATVEAKDPQDKPVTDLSDDPTNPANVDPNGDGNPDDPTVTPLVTNPPVAVDDNKSGTPGQSVTLDTLANDSDINGDLDPKTVKILDPDGNPVTELVVAGEGKWTVDPDNGKITFTPEAGFYADPAPIQYTVQDTAGHTSNPATETVDYNQEPKISLEKVGTVNKGADDKLNAGDTITYMFTVANRGNTSLSNIKINDDRIGAVNLAVNDLAPGSSGFAYTNYTITSQDLVDGNVTNQAIVTGDSPEGTTVTDKSDDPTNPANVDPDGDGNPDDPTVTFLVTHPPVTVDDNKSGIVGQAVMLPTLSNDSDPDDDLDPKTVNLIPDSVPGSVGSDTDNDGDIDKVVVPNEGTWAVDPDNGSITFTPNDGFTNDPTPIDYNVKDSADNISNSSTEMVDYAQEPKIYIEKIGTIDKGADGKLNIGDKILYEFNVTNTGNVPLNNIRINDSRIDVADLEVSDLAIGKYAIVTYTYTIAAQDLIDGNVTNQAMVTAEDPEGNDVTDKSDDPTNPANVDPDGDGNPDDPTVTILNTNKPVAVDDKKNGEIGNPITLPTLSNDSDPDDDLDPKTVNLIPDSVPGSVGSDTDNDGDIDKVVVPNEGTWTVDPDNGSITFTPNDGFTNDPTPIDYNVKDSIGHTSNNATETIDYIACPAIDIRKIGMVNNGVDDVLNVGDTINYYFYVKNYGNVPLTNIKINDNRIGVDNLAVNDLAPGSSDVVYTTYIITAQDLIDGNVTNQATVTAEDSEGNNVTDKSDDPTNPANVDPDGDGNPDDPTVTPLHTQPPVAMDDNKSGVVGQPVTVHVVGNDSDVNGDLDPTTVKIIDPDGNPVTELVVPGQGTWTVDPATGDITFTPENGFTGDPTPIQYTVQDKAGHTSNPATVTIDYGQEPELTLNKTAQLNAGNDGLQAGDTITYTFAVTNTGNVPVSGVEVSDARLNVQHLVIGDLAVGQTVQKTAEYTLTQDDINDGNVTNSATATGQDPEGNDVTDVSDNNTPDEDQNGDGDNGNDPTVTELATQPPVAMDDNKSGVVGQPVTVHVVGNDSDVNGDLDPTTVKIIDPDGNPVTELVVPGQGTWTVDPATGDITFTPENGFTGDPTPIQYTVQDKAGHTSNPATVTIDYGQEPELTLNKTAQLNAGNDGLQAGDTITYTFAVTNTGNVPVSGVEVSDARLNVQHLVIGDLAVGQTVQKTAEYTLTQDDINDGNVTNSATATGQDPEGNDVTDVSDNNTPDEDQNGDGDNGNDPTVTELATQPPVAMDDNKSGVVGQPVTVHVVGNDSDVNGDLDPTTVKIIDPDGNPVTELVVPGQGTWTVDPATGDITFTPENGFTGDPTPIQYTVQDKAGHTSNPATVTIDYGQEPELTLNKTAQLNAGNDGLQAGDTITYTFAVTNTGNVPVSGVEVSDARLNVQHLVIGDLAVGQTVQKTAEYTLTQDDINDGNVTNSATATGQDPEGNDVTDVSDNNTPDEDQNGDGDNGNDPTVTELATQPPVAMDDNKSGVVGQPVTVHVVGNDSDVNGDLDPTTVKIIDPDGNPVTELVVPGQGTWTVDPATGDITFTPENGFTGDPTPIQYTVQDKAGHTSNPATVTIDYGQEPELTLNKTAQLNAGNDGLQAGDTITYTFAVTNTGNVPVSGVEVSDARLNVQHLVIGDLAVGQTVQKTAEYTLTQDDINDGNVTNSATATGQDPEGNDVTDVSDNNTPDEDQNGDGDNGNDPTVTELATQPPVAMDDNKSGVVGQPVTVHVVGNDSDVNGDLDPTTVKIIDPDGNPVTELVVPGQGTWTVDPATGDITFTPENGFTGDPTPIQYTVQDKAGHTSNPATVTIDYGQEPELTLNKTAQLNAGNDGLQAGDTITYTFAVTNTGNVPVSGVEVSDARLNVQHLVIGDLAVGQTVQKTAEYTLTQDDINDGNVTNSATATGQDPEGNDVTDVSDNNTPDEDQNGDGDNGNDPTVTELATQPPVAMDDNKSGVVGQPVTVHVVGNDSDVNGDLDPTTVKIIDPDGNPVTELVVPGQGTWTVDPATGDITFTPENGFTGDPTPIQYTVQDKAGHTSNPATVTIDYGQEPELTLNKTAQLNAGNDGLQAGDTITYTFAVTNTGNVPVSGVEVSDARLNVQHLVIGDLAVGQTVQKTAEYTLTQDDINDGNVTNSATATGQDPEGNDVTDVSDNNTPDEDQNGDGDNGNDPTVTELATQPPVAMDDNKSGVVGQPVTVHVVGNDSDVNGDLDPTTVKIIDPDGNPVTELVVPGQGTWTVDPATGDITFTPENGFTGDPTPIQYTVQDKAGHTSNPATVTIDYGQEPELTLNKTAQLNAGNDGLQAGDTITYTFAVTNTGNVPVSGVEVSDARLNVQHLVIGDLAVGQTVQKTAEYTLTQDDINDGNVTNSATATGQDPEGNDVTDVSDNNTPDEDQNGDGDNGNDPTVTELATQPPVAMDDNKSGVVGQPVTVHVVGNDSDVNGDLDPTTVKIIDPDGNPVTELVVPGQGTWTVDPATGDITFTPENGFTGDPTPIQYTVQDKAGHTSNPATVTIDYGQDNASIGDMVWEDTDNDGIQDTNEQGLEGVTVHLYKDGVDTGVSTTTGSDGHYIFSNLTPGDYSIKIDVPAGYEFSPKDQGGDDAKDSDVNANNSTTDVTTLVAGENDTNCDAGLHEIEDNDNDEAAIGNYIWNDSNQNGIQEAAEKGMSGVTVHLYKDGVDTGKSIVTDASGQYLFEHLTPGHYSIKVDLPTVDGYSYHFTQKDQGSDDTIDSDVNPSNGQTDTTELIADEYDASCDVGIYKRAEVAEHVGQVKIGDLVWIEDDNDGNPATGLISYPPAGTVLKAVQSDGTVVTAKTDADGHYEMWVDENDTYMVTVEGLSYLTPTAGSGDSAINDAVSEDNHSHNPNGTTVSVGTVDNMTVDFGYKSADFAHLGDYFWVDSNGDGIQNADEEPVVGATVQLIDYNGKLGKDIHGNDTQTTDDNGRYGFDVVPGKNYRLRFVIPKKWEDDGYVFSKPNAGGNDMTDSDVDSDGYTALVTPQKGDIVSTLDAGIKCPCADITSDGIGALGKTAGWLLMLMMLALGTILIRREETLSPRD